MPAPAASLIADAPVEVRVRLSRLKESTQRQYTGALGRFQAFADAKRWPTAATAEELDAQLVRFAENIFATGDGAGRQTAMCARLACVWLNPALAQALPRSRAMTSRVAWYRAAGRVVRRHPPITWPLALVAAQDMADRGQSGACVATLTAFDCLLRISEAAALRLGDVRQVADADARLVRAGAPELVLAVAHAKTASDGDVQSAYVLTPAVTALLRGWIGLRRAAGAGDEDSLFALTPAQLHAAFTAATERLGARVRYTWHSLRHGGATLLDMAGWSTIEVMRHGRWRSEKTAWHYMQSGRAALAAHGVAPDTVQKGERLAAAIGSALPQRPAAQVS